MDSADEQNSLDSNFGDEQCTSTPLQINLPAAQTSEFSGKSFHGFDCTPITTPGHSSVFGEQNPLCAPKPDREKEPEESLSKDQPKSTDFSRNKRGEENKKPTIEDLFYILTAKIKDLKKDNNAQFEELKCDKKLQMEELNAIRSDIKAKRGGFYHDIEEINIKSKKIDKKVNEESYKPIGNNIEDVKERSGEDDCPIDKKGNRKEKQTNKMATAPSKKPSESVLIKKEVRGTEVKRNSFHPSEGCEILRIENTKKLGKNWDFRFLLDDKRGKNKHSQVSSSTKNQRDVKLKKKRLRKESFSEKDDPRSEKTKNKKQKHKNFKEQTTYYEIQQQSNGQDEDEGRHKRKAREDDKRGIGRSNRKKKKSNVDNLFQKRR